MSKIFINDNPTISVKLKKDHGDTNAERKFRQLYDEQLKIQKAEKELLSPQKQPVLSNQKRSSKKIQMLPDKVVVSDEQTLEMLQKRLESLVEDYNVKAAEQHTPREELERLEVQINITRQFMYERKRQIREKLKKTTLNKSESEEKMKLESGSPSPSPSRVAKL